MSSRSNMLRWIASAAVLMSVVLAQPGETVSTPAAPGEAGFVEEPKGDSWAEPTCAKYCITDACTNLNGNLTMECGSCTPDDSKCYPGAEGFDTWETRRDKHNLGSSADYSETAKPEL